MNLEKRIRIPSDINEHLQTLHDLAASIPGCVVVEFGTRSGNSTCAFLTAGATVFSYDIENVSFVPEKEHAERWHFVKADTGKLADVPPCDILFIDSLHTGAHVRAELKHGIAARRYIVFHDTILFGSYGELGQSGITGAIYDFLAENPHWRVEVHYENNNGLLILERSGSQCHSAFHQLMQNIEHIRDRAKRYAEQDESEKSWEEAEKQRKVEGTLNEILRIGKEIARQVAK